MELAQLAFEVCAVLKGMADTAEANQEKVRSLVNRTSSLEKPIQALQSEMERRTKEDGEGADLGTYEDVLKRLVETLQQCQQFVEKISKKSALKKFLSGSSISDEHAKLMAELDVCVSDAQLAVLSDDIHNRERNMERQAALTTQRMLEAKAAAKKEEWLICVHCGVKYRESENAEGSCEYHASTRDFHDVYRCCKQKYAPPRLHELPQPWRPGQPPPGPPKEIPGARAAREAYFVPGCQHGVHRAAHHNDFPYEAHQGWVNAEMREEHKVAVTCKDTHLEDGWSVEVEVGTFDESGDLYISAGSLLTDFFWKYPASVLEMLPQHLTETAMLACEVFTSDGGRGTAEWSVVDGKIDALVVSAKSATSPRAEMYLIPLQTNDGRVECGEPRRMSRGGFQEKVPSKDYDIPQEILISGPQIPTSDPRPPRTDFTTEITGGAAARIRVVTPLKANAESRGFESDIFTAEVQLINLDHEHDQTYLGGAASFRVEGEDSYKPCEITFTNDQPSTFPLNIQKRGGAALQLKIMVPHDTEKGVAPSWYNRSWVARLKPIEIRVEFEDLDGSRIALSMEFVNPALKLPTANPTDLCFGFCDDVDGFERRVVRVTPSDDEDIMCNFENQVSGCTTSYYIRETLLQSWAYRATKERCSELKIDDWCSEGSETALGVYALVDLRCFRVYALKFFIKTRTGASLTYYRLPLYGDTSSTADPEPATEKVVLGDGSAVRAAAESAAVKEMRVREVESAAAVIARGGSASADAVAALAARLDRIEARLDAALQDGGARGGAEDSVQEMLSRLELIAERLTSAQEPAQEPGTASPGNGGSGIGVVPSVAELLMREGNAEEQAMVSSPALLHEDTVLKFNRRGQKQERQLLLSSHALYNTKPRRSGGLECHRRISLEKIEKVVRSSASGELVIVVPSEYDYHFSFDIGRKAHQRPEVRAERFSQLLIAAATKLRGSPVQESVVQDESLKAHVVNAKD